MKVWTLYWSPEGRPLAIVEAKCEKAAIRKTPQPYRQYLGEIYALEEVNERLENTSQDFRPTSKPGQMGDKLWKRGSIL